MEYLLTWCIGNGFHYFNGIVVLELLGGSQTDSQTAIGFYITWFALISQSNEDF